MYVFVSTVMTEQSLLTCLGLHTFYLYLHRTCILVTLNTDVWHLPLPTNLYLLSAIRWISSPRRQPTSIFLSGMYSLNPLNSSKWFISSFIHGIRPSRSESLIRTSPSQTESSSYWYLSKSTKFQIYHIVWFGFKSPSVYTLL